MGMHVQDERDGKLFLTPRFGLSDLLVRISIFGDCKHIAASAVKDCSKDA